MPRNAVACLAALAALANGCTVDLPDTHPSRQSSLPSAPAPVIVVQPIGAAGTPIPPPSANPTSVPVPTSAPIPSSPVSTPAPAAPAPTRAPTSAPPPPSGGNCSLGRGPGDGNDCPRTSPAFLDDVDAAIVRVIAKRPDLVRGNRVDNWNAYYAAVVDELRADGYCAIFDGEEIALKNTNDFNEQYHVLTSAGVVRRGEGSYRATCRPAWF